ncbi:hypothetical protein K32_19200 [Kaistia sp. 32K]|uniref:hypothetical protein n=1 Tax=Kaistia sp. 32K TaxID=2795690 RepID=UPI001915937E|nr:hypothetical protein [Kaistia sp. 32K]BCP53303.1 hypothetical protein K32_19200 [Kaistia sp. 32K]
MTNERIGIQQTPGRIFDARSWALSQTSITTLDRWPKLQDENRAKTPVLKAPKGIKRR